MLNNAAICTSCFGMGLSCWSGFIRVWHAFDQANQGNAHLSQDRKSSGGELLLGHTKVESTVRYLGIEVDDALAIAEQVDV